MTTKLRQLQEGLTYLAVRVRHRPSPGRDRGAAMAEYGLLLSLVALAAVAALALFGGELLELYTDAEDDFDTLPPPPAAD